MRDILGVYNFDGSEYFSKDGEIHSEIILPFGYLLESPFLETTGISFHDNEIIG